MKVFKLEKVIAHMKNGVNVKQNKNGVGDRLSRIETISDGNFNFDKVGFADLSSDQKSKYKININDILFSHINSLEHLGKTAIYEANQEIYHGVNLLLIRANDLVLPKYLRYFFIFLRNSGYWIKNGKQAINQASVNQTDIKNIQIPVPSLQEQEKIVERLDKVFEIISKKIQLTEEKIIKINTMFTSFLNKVFNNHLTELNMKSLDKLFNIQIGRTPSRGDKQLWDTKKTTNNIWLSIKDLNNIDENGFISDSYEYISKKAESSVPLVPENTLLISFKLTLGRSAISKVPLRTNEAIAALLPKTNTYDINYLKYYFEYFDFIKFAKNDFKVKGLTLNKKKLAEIKIPIIPFQEQNEAVKQLNQISNSVKTLISNYEEQLLLLSNLKKSYLIKEFSYE